MATPVPGAVILGKYRLLSRSPAAGWTSTWDAVEITSSRHVSLTLAHTGDINSRSTSDRPVDAFCADARVDPDVVQVAVESPYVVIVRAQTFTAPITEAPPKRWNPATSVVLAAAVVGAFGVGGWFLATSIYGGNYGDVDNTVSAPDLPRAQPVEVVVPQAVLPAAAQAWSAVRAPDNSGDAGLCVDANPGTSWSTDRYRAPFQETDNGIGVLVTFAEDVDIAEVWVSTLNPGTLVEIRTPPEDVLASTQVLGSGVLGVGATHIPIDEPSPTRALLIWVAELAPSGTQYESDFAEVGFTRK